MVDTVMFKSGSTEWGTPPLLVTALEGLFGKFELDPCSRLEQFAKAPRWYSPSQDGLAQPWDGRVFCNPPWSKKAPIDPWIQKAVESQHAATLLVPARTDTKWFRRIFENASVIAFISGRLFYEILETSEERERRHAAWWADWVKASPEKRKKFGNKPSDGTSAPFPSAVAHFSKRPGKQVVGLMSTVGELLV